MKKISIIISALVFISSAVFSQGQLDAYKYSQTDLGGTARYLGMGGAFGALGGDISVMSANPAGLAVYRSSEIVTTLSHKVISTSTNQPTATGSSNRFNFDNIAYVGYFPSSNDAGILGWNVGFSYNRLKDYHRNYTMLSMGDKDYSLSDYIAERANAKGVHKDDLSYSNGYDPYASPNGNDWLSVLGYDAVFIDAMDVGNRYISAFGENVNGTMHPFQLSGRELNVRERGAIDQYNIAFGLNISDIALVGANVAITNISYHYNSYFAEDFANNNYLNLENWLRTEGSGYALNVGAILRPVNFLRVGVAYNSPTWYEMTDRYQATANSVTNYWDEPRIDIRTPEGITEYQYRSPDKWLFSVAAIIGRTALLSVDYELTNYKNMKMYDWEGIEDQVTNNEVNTNFASVGALRVGGEVKVTPRFAVRAGAAWIGNPMNNVLKNATSEVYTVGTIPHYTTEESITNYTVGLGYRFTSNFYMDIACVLKAQKENLYGFSKIYADNELIINSTPTVLKTNTTHVALTLGYKF
ncbi:MAG: hypothetical protein LBB84_10220 [Tannerellaceae bacterium]|jgi:hypothetical protein|nr:hypothetical protein [Tannerellaceae bacterium]